MTNDQLRAAFSTLSTPLICDACLRQQVPYRVPAPGLGPLRRPVRIAGRAWPARHAGSVDIFLEAIETAQPGDVLVIDNGGRRDEACIGDLIVLEAQRAGLGGIALWGLLRDTAELAAIELPVFSYGATPSGPRRLDPRAADALASADFGGFPVTAADVVFGDDDGLAFVAAEQAARVLAAAEGLLATEREQAAAIRAGTTLRAQLRFGEYLRARQRDPSYTLRRHLKHVGGAIEE